MQDPRTAFSTGSLTEEKALLVYLFAGSVLLALILMNPFIGHWDSYDYMKQILTHQRSSLMLGRPYFIGYNIVLWEVFHSVFHISPANAYLIVKYGILVMTGLTSIAFYYFVRDLLSSRIAYFSAWLLALSPVYLTYGGMVMTEMPMLLTLFTGFHLYQSGIIDNRRAKMILGAFLAGSSVHFREQSLMMLPYLGFIPFYLGKNNFSALKWSYLLAFASVLAGLLIGPLFLLYTDGHSYLMTIVKWRSYMEEQAGLHPIGWNNLFHFLKWLFACAPVALIPSIYGIIKLARQNLKHPALGFIAWNGLIILSLSFYQDLLYSPRYFLIAVPAVSMAAAIGMEPLLTSSGRKWSAIVAIAVVSIFILVGAKIITSPYNRINHKAKVYHREIEKFPPNSVFIVGQFCPLIGYYKAIGYPESWDVICSGWTWPRENLKTVIDAYLAGGVAVFADLDPILWYGSRLNEEREQLLAMGTRYHFVPLKDELVQIRWNESHRYGDVPE